MKYVYVGKEVVSDSLKARAEKKLPASRAICISFSRISFPPFPGV